jgi:hypothetical protein
MSAVQVQFLDHLKETDSGMKLGRASAAQACKVNMIP